MSFQAQSILADPVVEATLKISCDESSGSNTSMFPDDEPVDEDCSDEEDSITDVAEVAQVIEERLPHLNVYSSLSSYKTGDDTYLRGTWGAGSRRTEARQAQKRRKLTAAAEIPGQ